MNFLFKNGPYVWGSYILYGSVNKLTKERSEMKKMNAE